MPLQSSWVEIWLDRYCAPGSHSLVPWGPDSLVCARCGKVELLDNRTCMICGIPGETATCLRNARLPGLARAGKLCGVCYEEFGERETIREWKVDQNQAAG